MGKLSKGVECIKDVSHIKEKGLDTKLYIYRRLNSQKYLKTSQRVLVSKLDGSYIFDYERFDEQDDSLPKKPRKRYYTPPDEVCQICKFEVHSTPVCPFEYTIRCFFCGKKHLLDKCEQIACTLCARRGHEESDCPFFQLKESSGEFGIKCQGCQKLGHSHLECQVIYQKPANDEETKELQCLYCMEYGHVNCMPLKEDKLYDCYRTPTEEEEYDLYYLHNF